MSIIKRLYQGLVYWVHCLVLSIDPRIEMARCFHKVFGEFPNFKRPKSFIEKIYWLQLNTDTELWSLCTDKYRVREYVTRKGLGMYLNTLYAVWEKPDDVDLSFLPKEFILKSNNGCNQLIVVKNKDEVDVKGVLKQLRWWYKHPFGVSGGQLHYLKIKPCIIAEKLLPISEGEISLIDYKIWCFSGEPYCILVTFGRTESTVNIALYDLEWNPMPQYIKSTGHVLAQSGKEISRPECLEEMLRISKILSDGIPQVRVDLYNIKNRPVFGELTFSTGFGYFTDDFYQKISDLTILPDSQKCIESH